MISLIIGIVILCAVVFIVFRLLPVPANIQQVIWIIVCIVILIWVASAFGFGPDWGHMGGHDVRVR
jgi:hypothetical protein